MLCDMSVKISLRETHKDRICPAPSKVIHDHGPVNLLKRIDRHILCPCFLVAGGRIIRGLVG